MKPLPISVGLLLTLSVLTGRLPGQVTLEDAEKLSARTGRTLFVVAGRKT